MATNFPTSLDTYTDRTDTVDNVVAADVNDPHDAIEQLEIKVGVDGSAVTTSHSYRIDQLRAGTGMTGSSQATAFIPTGSTVPSNGLYLPAANNAAISTNSVQRLRFASDGQMGFAGGSLTTGTTNGRLFFATQLSTGRLTTDAGAEIISVHTWLDASVLELSAGSTSSNRNGVVFRGGGATTRPNTYSLYTNDTERIRTDNVGQTTFYAPTSGIPLNIIGILNSQVSRFSATSGGAFDIMSWTGAVTIGTPNADTLTLFTNSTNRLAISSTGAVTIAAPTSGVGLTVSAVSGTHSTKIADSANNSYNAGFLESPINEQDGNYTMVLSDSGKTIWHNSGVGHTYTIPANGSVAYPTGTTISIVNVSGGGNITLSITTDTLTWLGTGGTGSRTLAANGRATIQKITSTGWVVSGTNLT